MPTTIGVNHYWPGQAVPMPLPDDGVVSSWNNGFVRSLPAGPSFPNDYPGYDQNRPTGLSQNGGQLVVFQIVGDGQSVDFVCSSDVKGCVMTLWCPGHPEENLVLGGFTYPWVDYSADTPATGTPSPPYLPRAAIRHFLASGKTYYLEIGSASTGSSSTYDQDLRLDVTYTPEKLNDRRDDANDVVIWDDGMRYTGVPMLNANYVPSGAAGTDDPTGSDVYYSGWWLYQPTKSGDVDISWAVVPQGSNWFRMNVWKGTTTLTKIENTTLNPSTVTVTVEAGDYIWIQVGAVSTTNAYSSGSHPLAQSYQVSVVGSKSAVQLPDTSGDDPPAPDPTDDTDTDKPTPTVSDPIDPTEIVPIKPVPDGDPKQCSTILDLVRAFQKAAKAVVRIEGAASISIVDPNEPLPTGFVNGRGARYYASTELGLASDSKVLRLSKGTMDLNGRAHLVTDDVGLITSGWRIPQRLPFPDLDPAPVSRVSYTFTTKTFSADVEFAFPDVPLKVRGS